MLLTLASHQILETASDWSASDWLPEIILEPGYDYVWRVAPLDKLVPFFTARIRGVITQATLINVCERKNLVSTRLPLTSLVPLTVEVCYFTESGFAAAAPTQGVCGV